VTNDVAAMEEGSSMYAAMLTAQGKLQHDLVVHHRGSEGLLLDVCRQQAPAILQSLGRFKLRSKVQISDVRAGPLYPPSRPL